MNAKTQLVRESEAVVRRRERAEATRSQLNRSHSGAAGLAEETGLSDGHARALRGVVLPEAVSELATDFVATLLKEARDNELRRREQIGVIRKRLREVDAALQIRVRAHDVRVLYANTLDASSEAARNAAQKLHNGSAQLLSAWRLYGRAHGCCEYRISRRPWMPSSPGTRAWAAQTRRVRHSIGSANASRRTSPYRMPR